MSVCAVAEVVLVDEQTAYAPRDNDDKLGSVVAYEDKNQNGKLDLVPAKATSFVDGIVGANDELLVDVDFGVTLLVASTVLVYLFAVLVYPFATLTDRGSWMWMRSS